MMEGGACVRRGTHRLQLVAIDLAPSRQTRSRVLALPYLDVQGPYDCSPYHQATVLLVPHPQTSGGNPT